MYIFSAWKIWSPSYMTWADFWAEKHKFRIALYISGHCLIFVSFSKTKINLYWQYLYIVPKEDCKKCVNAYLYKINITQYL